MINSIVYLFFNARRGEAVRRDAASGGAAPKLILVSIFELHNNITTSNTHIVLALYVHPPPPQLTHNNFFLNLDMSKTGNESLTAKK